MMSVGAGSLSESGEQCPGVVQMSLDRSEALRQASAIVQVRRPRQIDCHTVAHLYDSANVMRQGCWHGPPPAGCDGHTRSLSGNTAVNPVC